MNVYLHQNFGKSSIRSNDLFGGYMHNKEINKPSHTKHDLFQVYQSEGHIGFTAQQTMLTIKCFLSL